MRMRRFRSCGAATRFSSAATLSTATAATDGATPRASSTSRRASPPPFYNLGNHERLLPDIAEYLPLVQKSDVTVLDDCFVAFRGITLGGVSSARKMPGMPPVRAQMDAKKPFLQAMAARDGFKLLLCHHPEYFAPLVQELDIDLTLAGHAHGGQVRIGSQGIYSPGQGLFPKLTSGFYFDDKLFISRGMTNSACAPRLWCPCELVMVRLLPNRAI